MSKENEKKWIFPNVLKEQGDEIDDLIDKHANDIRIFSRADFIRIAIVEKLEKVRAELKEKGKKV